MIVPIWAAVNLSFVNLDNPREREREILLFYELIGQMKI